MKKNENKYLYLINQCSKHIDRQRVPRSPRLFLHTIRIFFGRNKLFKFIKLQNPDIAYTMNLVRQVGFHMIMLSGPEMHTTYKS
jgi:hypothetical protein